VQGKSRNCQERNSIIAEYNHCLDHNQAILLRSFFKFWGKHHGAAEYFTSLEKRFVGFYWDSKQGK
jgi:hypothetical protein